MRWLLHQQLKSRQAANRRNAAEELAQGPIADDFKALVGALRDADAEVRRLVATAFCKIEHPQRTDALLHASADPSPDVQKVALSGLKTVTDPRVVPALLPLLHHADAGVRGSAAALLSARAWRPANREEELTFLIARGQFSKAAAFGVDAIAALRAATQAGAYTQRAAAVEALGRIRDQRAIPPLLEALKSTEPAVCIAAASALGARGGPEARQALPALLGHGNNNVRAVAVDAVGRAGGADVTEVLRPMLNDAAWDVRRAAAEILGRLKDPHSLPELAQALNDTDADVRETAANALGNLRDRRAIAPLVKALADASSGVRRTAAAAVSRVEENWSTSPEAEAAFEELKATLANSDSELRYIVARLLQNIGVLAHDSPSPEIPATSFVSPTERRQKLALQLLLETLADSDPILRQAAAESLGRLGEPRAVAALERALGDAEGAVRRSVEAALKSLGRGAAHSEIIL